MNKIISEIISKKLTQISKTADEEITVSKKMLGLEFSVALRSGFVLGMLLSPRKTVTYKIASNNNINSEDDEPDWEDEELGDEDEDSDKKHGKFIKL